MQIHWHEGLFLLPHHLQHLQRSVSESASAERQLNWSRCAALVLGASQLRESGSNR
jgi:predicted component of type VI protein secretion system